MRAFALLSISLLMGSMQVASRAEAQPVVGHVSHAQRIPHDSAGPSLDTPTPDGLNATQWASILNAYQTSRHTAYPTADGFQARNPGQRWLTHFDCRGFTTHPDNAAWTWGLQLESYGFAGQECVAAVPAHVRAKDTCVEYDWDENLQEWWINDARGLDHGYTVRRPPARAMNGYLRLTLSVRGDLIPVAQSDRSGVSFIDQSGICRVTYSGLAVRDANGCAVPARLDVISNQLMLSVEDWNASYPLTIDPLAQQAYLKASNTDAGDFFGASVSVSGDTVVVGAPREDSAAMGVNGDQSSNGASNSGAVYVFVRNGRTWNQQAYLKASNTDANDGFGEKVAISGDIVVVGAPHEASSALGVNGNQADNSAPGRGAAYVFSRVGSTWIQEGYLKSTNGAGAFGLAVSASNDTVVVGAEADHSFAFYGGGAFVYVRSGATWIFQSYLKASNTGPDDSFGEAVSISGDTIAVGAPYEDSNATGVNGNQTDNSASTSGAVYVFVRQASAWSQQAYVKASNTTALAYFGGSVSVSGDVLVVGSPYENSNATGVNGNQHDHSVLNAGAAYVFVRNAASWNQDAYLKASNTGQLQMFGVSVSATAQRVAVGAHGEKSGSSGVDGEQTNTAAPNSGAGYLFLRSRNGWTQEAYVKASNTSPGASFGWSVSLSSDSLVIGSYNENSGATGIGGNSSDTSSPSAGAVYVFALYPASVPYCAGDNSDSMCPCGNPGDAGKGCNNRTSSGGAGLTSSGLASISDDRLVLHGSGLNPFGPGLYYQGSTAASLAAPFGVGFGNGLLCAGGTTNRIEIRFADWDGRSATTVSIHLLGADSIGDVRYYQLWYRDSPSFGTCVSGYNLSNGLSLTWVP